MHLCWQVVCTIFQIGGQENGVGVPVHVVLVGSVGELPVTTKTPSIAMFLQNQWRKDLAIVALAQHGTMVTGILVLHVVQAFIKLAWFFVICPMDKSYQIQIVTFVKNQLRIGSAFVTISTGMLDPGTLVLQVVANLTKFGKSCVSMTRILKWHLLIAEEHLQSPVSVVG